MSSFQLHRLANADSDLTGDGETTADNNNKPKKNIDNNIKYNNKNRKMVSGFRDLRRYIITAPSFIDHSSAHHLI